MTDTLPTDNAVQIVAIDGREQASAQVLALMQQANREICFFGASIDQVLFDNDEAVTIISELARRNRQSMVRFVVQSTQKNIAQGHRLIRLAQRLTSSIAIHIAAREQQGMQQMFLLVDDHSLFFCPHHERYQGSIELNAKARVKQLKQEFDSYWANSRPDSNIRQLLI